MSLTNTARVTENRMERALKIYNGGLVRTVSAGTYVVKSESSNAYYIVNSHGCTCRDSVERQIICKHAWACFVGAVLTIWRIRDATSRHEIESLASLNFSGAPLGIARTLYLECEKAYERIEA
ncbi:MAG: hypothetical protein WBV94_14815 [Blastocatellia bacterium]